jgi:hypothetical protein
MILLNVLSFEFIQVRREHKRDIKKDYSVQHQHGQKKNKMELSHVIETDKIQPRIFRTGKFGSEDQFEPVAARHPHHGVLRTSGTTGYKVDFNSNQSQCRL